MITSKEVPQETWVGFSWMKNVTIKKWPLINKNGEKYGNLLLCLLLFLKKMNRMIENTKGKEFYFLVKCTLCNLKILKLLYVIYEI